MLRIALDQLEPGRGQRLKVTGGERQATKTGQAFRPSFLEESGPGFGKSITEEMMPAF